MWPSFTAAPWKNLDKVLMPIYICGLIRMISDTDTSRPITIIFSKVGKYSERLKSSDIGYHLM